MKTASIEEGIRALRDHARVGSSPKMGELADAMEEELRLLRGTHAPTTLPPVQPPADDLGPYGYGDFKPGTKPEPREMERLVEQMREEATAALKSMPEAIRGKKWLDGKTWWSEEGGEKQVIEVMPPWPGGTRESAFTVVSGDFTPEIRQHFLLSQPHIVLTVLEDYAELRALAGIHLSLLEVDGAECTCFPDDPCSLCRLQRVLGRRVRR